MSVTQEEYIQLYEELQALVKAWKDRLDIPEYTAATVFLQIGGTMAAWGGTSLEQALRFVESAWKTADATPKEST